ncbi:siderophore-iron reductase FhuF [Granulibacter bethesdensis]|nr:siderophore-iron reductase FhuF [Granulibacter bethesdensis]
MRKDEDIAAWCEARMASPADFSPADGVDVSLLTRRETLAPGIERFAKTLPAGADPRAIGSLWSKAYTRAVLPSLFILAIRDGRNALDPAQAVPPGLVLLKDRPDQLALDAALPPRQTPEQIMTIALGQHMQSVFTALRDCTGLSPRVAWSNAGNMADFLFRRMAETPSLADQAAQYEALIMEPRQTPWFPRQNWLHAPLRTVSVILDGEAVPLRQRRICCLRDRVPGMTLCSTCPRLSEAERRALVGQRHRH